MLGKLFVTIIFSLVVASHAAADIEGDGCSATIITRSLTEQPWERQGGGYASEYDVSATNNGRCPISSLILNFGDAAITIQYWQMTKGNEGYLLKLYDNGQLGVGLSTFAGFIANHSSAAAPAITATAIARCPLSCMDNSGSATEAPTSTPTQAPSAQAPTSAPPTPAPITDDYLGSLIDAPSALARLKLLKDEHHVFDFKNSLLGITKSTGGKTVAATAETFPAVIGNGIAMTVGYIEPCGINLPHTHPRATEINFIAKGSFQAGFFLENGAQFIGHTLQAGMATVFPQGSVHFEVNLECEPAIFVAAFNSEDPGVQTTAQSFFGLPKDIAAVSLNISDIQTVEDLARYLPSNPAVAMHQCMKRCGFSS